MKLLFVVEADFFEGCLDGRRIPLLLRMIQALTGGHNVHVALGPDRHELTVPKNALTMDAVHGAAKLTPVDGPTTYDLAVFQKGCSLPETDGLNWYQSALMLNDAHARQAYNQLYELLSGRFGFDLYRVSAPLRLLQGLRHDIAQMRRFDTIYVQTPPEANFLRLFAPWAKARIEIFNNAVLTRDLFPDLIRPPTGSRRRDFLLPVPPGIRREPEYAWFLRRLAAYDDLCSRTTVLAPPSFTRHVPPGMAHDSDVPDFQVYLQDFACVLVPTKHFTGINNRVFQAAAAGCDVIASREALEGLISGAPELSQMPRSFAAFRDAMKGYPKTALTPKMLLP